MRAVQRLRFEPTAIVPHRLTVIDRYLGREDHARSGSWQFASSATGLDTIHLVLHDTGGPTFRLEARAGAATIWHVLWVRDETASRVRIDNATWGIVPGDSVIAPKGAALNVEGRQLAVEIAVPGTDVPLEPPTHGEEHYFGHNRQTVCCRAGDIRLCRWKLTQPLALAEHHPQPVLTLALARNSTIRTSTEIDRLRQGEFALIDPAADPIITPDGLSYLLTIDRDPSAEGR